MNLFHAIILGIIQGLTEFIPISSTGHLILAEKLMGLERTMTPEQITAFVAVIQLGTLVAVIVYFIRDIMSITLGFLQGNLLWLRGIRDASPRKAARLGWLIIIGSIPIGTIGLLAKKIIEGNLTKNLMVIGVSMISWAVMLFLAEQFGKRRNEIEHIGIREALIVGVAQVFALVPGSSRSGTTITGALFAGMSREAAARFSFLLSIPTIGASGLLEFKQALHFMSGVGSVNLAVSTAVSALVGYASIAFLIGYLRRHTTYAFIIYRLIVGAAVLGLALHGV
ncbi:MAG TPA: undecaprenyl-diphosphatase UppP [Blastocatellia bacterium]|nr:undecaprenyl-diphosphatase UppP [Blastocatellia bacterium]